jgi:hypothetical protein
MTENLDESKYKGFSSQLEEAEAYFTLRSQFKKAALKDGDQV